MKMKIEHIKINPNTINGGRHPNPMHLDAQQRFRANVFKPKKGKGSFNRKNNNKIDY